MIGPFLAILMIWIFSLCLHEYFHARVAFAGGDYTVRDKGYLSFNPLHYMNPVQSILWPVAAMMVGGFALPGGAVWIETWRLRSKGWRSAVSLAGPAANVVMCLVLGLPFAFKDFSGGESTGAVWPILAICCELQACAVVLNLLPIPGLDGFGAIAPWLPRDVQVAANRFGAYSMFIVLALFVGVPQFSRKFWFVVDAMIGVFHIPAYLLRDGQRMLDIFHRFG